MESGKIAAAPPAGSARLLLAAGAALWWGAIVAAPLVDLDWVYTFFSAICHQNPDRVWHLAGAPLPVCVRCASIYAGFLLALLGRIPPNSRFLRVALAATLLEFLIARAGLDLEPARAATGLLLGLAAAGFVGAGVAELLRDRISRTFARADQ